MTNTTSSAKGAIQFQSTYSPHTAKLNRIFSTIAIPPYTMAATGAAHGSVRVKPLALLDQTKPIKNTTEQANYMEKQFKQTRV